MIRALWFALQLGLLIAAAIWAVRQPGTVRVDWLGYEVSAHVGLILTGLLLTLFLSLFIHRIYLAAAGLPGLFRRRGEQERIKKGYRALTRGLSAVAAGDARQAGVFAAQARKLWPDDRVLSVFLEAQAARLKGDHEKAEQAFRELMMNPDAAFLALRGLISAAMEDGLTDKALSYARKALSLHPRQKWLLRTVYDLEITARDWDAAQITLKSAQKQKAIEDNMARSDSIAMLMYRAEALSDGDSAPDAEKLLAEANRIDPGFVPAAVRLARLHIAGGRKRRAISIIETAWKLRPHPELATVWEMLAPENKPLDSSARLRWFEKLVALRPDAAESQIAAARVALEDGMWGEARQYLNMAGQIRESAALFRMQAKLAERTGHPAEAAHWLEKAADAPAGDVWYCKRTGRIYDRWSPIAAPHGAFNSIVWGLPQAGVSEFLTESMPETRQLLSA